MGTRRRVRWLVVLMLVSPIIVVSSQTEGRLVVSVTIGDDKQPYSNAVVYVRGYRPQYNGETSTILQASQKGRFEASLPPGLYDIFVSDASSIPMCKRVEIVANETEHYTASLTADVEHLME